MKTKIFLGLALFGLASASTAAAVPTTARGFDSPEAARSSLQEAVSSGESARLKEIFGDEFIERIGSGDPVQDKLGAERLALLMEEDSEIVTQADGSRILEVGKSRWPFPAPLVERSGEWYFDGDSGVDELLNRRIGEAEILALKVCRFYAGAQEVYRAKDRTGRGSEYAQRFVSTPGKKDGLYWKMVDAHDASPFDPVAHKMIEEGYGGQKRAAGVDPIYRGYHYRILKSQGESAFGGKKNFLDKNGRMTQGYGLLAYPTRWGASGIMSFMVGPDGSIYENDLGESTQKLASSIRAFEPSAGWRAVTE